MKRLLFGLVAALYVVACFLPGEPSGEQRIEFHLDFAVPYRVPLAGTAEPTLKITVAGQALSQPHYRLESLDPRIARVDPTGRGLEGTRRGTTSVRVVYQTATATADTVFPVQVVVSRIAVGPPTMTLTQLGFTTPLTATAYDAQDAPVPNVTFTWSSADPGVAAVNDAGLVRALDEGTVTITAEADSVNGLASITVTQVAAQVRLAPELDTLRTVGRSAQLLAIAFDDAGGVIRTARPRWTSSDPMVATVDGAGLATATGAGIARIVARVGQAADTATLVIAQVIRFIVVTPRYDTLTAIADTGRLAALAFDSLNFPIPNPSVGWTTSDAAIATVNPAGLVRAERNGVVLVTASAAGQAASTTILVRQDVVGARIAQDRLALTGSGDTLRLAALGIDRNGYPVTGAALSWRSGSLCVATVDDGGLVTARGAGEAAVIATPMNGGRSDTAAVTVTGTPASQIAFVLSDRGMYRIYTLCDLEGSPTPLILTTSDQSVLHPAWSPDGAAIAFSRAGDVSTETWCGRRIYIARRDGSDARRVTDLCSGGPAWSPDGTRIAFGGSAAPDDFGGIYTANTDGSNARRVCCDNRYGPFSRPTWSPDGTRIAFAWVPARDTSEIAVIDADGTGFRVILKGDRASNNPDNYGLSNPAWSPDGSQLVFSDHYNLLLITPDGSGLTVLVPGGWDGGNLVENYQPAWSPDGAQIVFGCGFYIAPDPEHGGFGSSWRGLCAINRDGTGYRRSRHPFQDTPLSPTWGRIPATTAAGTVVRTQSRW